MPLTKLDPVELMGFTIYISEETVMRPKAVAFPATVRELAMVRDGIRRIIVPADATWDDFFEAPGAELGPRAQPAHQQRDPV